MEKTSWYKTHVKIPPRLFLFSRQLFHAYRKATGADFEDRLKLWLYAGGPAKLPPADYLLIVKVFDVCSEQHGNCETCPPEQKTVCAEVFKIIVERSRYAYKEEGSSKTEPPSYPVTGAARKIINRV